MTTLAELAAWPRDEYGNLVSPTTGMPMSPGDAGYPTVTQTEAPPFRTKVDSSTGVRHYGFGPFADEGGQGDNYWGTLEAATNEYQNRYGVAPGAPQDAGSFNGAAMVERGSAEATGIDALMQKLTEGAIAYGTGQAFGPLISSAFTQAPAPVTDLSFSAGGAPVGSAPAGSEFGPLTFEQANPNNFLPVSADPVTDYSKFWRVDDAGRFVLTPEAAAGFDSLGGLRAATSAGSGGVSAPTLGQVAQGATIAGGAAALAGGTGRDEPAYQDPGSLDVYGNSSAGEYGDPAATPGWLSEALGSVNAANQFLKDNPGVAKVLGAVVPAGIGAVAASRQADAYKDLATKFASYGEPSRARYEATFAPGFDINSIPGLTEAVDTSANAVLRKLSTQGNPYSNPGGLMEATKYVTGNVALPALQNYRNQNAATGGFGAFNTAAPSAAATATGSDMNWLNAIGVGADRLLNPQTDLASLLSRIKGRGLSLSLT